MPQHTPAPTPTRAVYGFVMYLSFEIFFIIYVIWAIVPEEYLELIGITFLPQRYWAVAVPIYFLIVLTIFAFVIYPALGWSMTPDVDDLRTIKDDIGGKRKCNNVHEVVNHTKEEGCICKDKEKCYKEYYNTVQSAVVNKSIPRLKDIDMWEVSENLFLK
ncbi:phosphatidylinositol N-acetylglucosaminyltransferase subunit P [Anoplophora glabripennis]|uniref:phosphatidylinositol N-acetylglucosaminyltransferase subunit P n=1 Tax=Anoplophora glabripennis TaxID=217634 RepID=UPI000874C6EA|nr:phosphatidylinositol N-acetylglucosaminyltransferase subunit P [Anoplophora glabripennis]